MSSPIIKPTDLQAPISDTLRPGRRTFRYVQVARDAFLSEYPNGKWGKAFILVEDLTPEKFAGKNVKDFWRVLAQDPRSRLFCMLQACFSHDGHIAVSLNQAEHYAMHGRLSDELKAPPLAAAIVDPVLVSHSLIQLVHRDPSLVDGPGRIAVPKKVFAHLGEFLAGRRGGPVVFTPPRGSKDFLPHAEGSILFFRRDDRDKKYVDKYQVAVFSSIDDFHRRNFYEDRKHRQETPGHATLQGRAISLIQKLANGGDLKDKNFIKELKDFQSTGEEEYRGKSDARKQRAYVLFRDLFKGFEGGLHRSRLTSKLLGLCHQLSGRNVNIRGMEPYNAQQSFDTLGRIYLLRSIVCELLGKDELLTTQEELFEQKQAMEKALQPGPQAVDVRPYLTYLRLALNVLNKKCEEYKTATSSVSPAQDPELQFLREVYVYQRKLDDMRLAYQESLPKEQDGRHDKSKVLSDKHFKEVERAFEELKKQTAGLPEASALRSAINAADQELQAVHAKKHTQRSLVDRGFSIEQFFANIPANTPSA